MVVSGDFLIRPKEAVLAFGGHLLTEPLPGAPIGGLAADPVDTATPDNGDNPTERVALLGPVVSGVSPKLMQTFLEDIVDIVIVIEDAGSDRAEQRLMAVVDGRESLFVTVLNSLHQFFIGDFIADWNRWKVFGWILIEGVEHSGFGCDPLLLPNSCQTSIPLVKA